MDPQDPSFQATQVGMMGALRTDGQPTEPDRGHDARHARSNRDQEDLGQCQPAKFRRGVCRAPLLVTLLLPLN